MRELLTTAEFAREVDRTPAAIRAAARAGRIRAEVETPSGQRLFTRAEAMRFKGGGAAKRRKGQAAA